MSQYNKSKLFPLLRHRLSIFNMSNVFNLFISNRYVMYSFTVFLEAEVMTKFTKKVNSHYCKDFYIMKNITTSCETEPASYTCSINTMNMHEVFISVYDISLVCHKAPYHVMLVNKNIGEFEPISDTSVMVTLTSVWAYVVKTRIMLPEVIHMYKRLARFHNSVSDGVCFMIMIKLIEE